MRFFVVSVENQLNLVDVHVEKPCSFVNVKRFKHVEIILKRKC